MMCFRDRTFCGAQCFNAECDRRLTPEVTEAAERWWGKPGAPIAMADLSARCGVAILTDPASPEPQP